MFVPMGDSHASVPGIGACPDVSSSPGRVPLRIPLLGLQPRAGEVSAELEMGIAVPGMVTGVLH